MTPVPYLIGLALSGAVALSLALVGGHTEVARIPTSDTAEAAVAAFDSAPSAAWARRAPFRRSRTLSAVGYDARRIMAAERAPPGQPKPVLTLRGVVGGGQPAAIVEGLPGVDGPRVVRAGDRINGLAVRRIASGRVLITGLDTTWTLELPHGAP